MKIAIIGGGIAGLAAAHYLEKKADESNTQVEITVFEAADYWGGKIKTVVEDSFVIEGGPDAYLITKPWMRNLCRELGIDQGLHGTSQEHTETFILHKGELISIPTGLTMTIPTEFGPLLKTKLLSIPEKARMGLDFAIPPRKSNIDESLAGFITRRLGRAAYENLVGPLLSGIYAGDGDRLSLQSTFPNFRDMEIEHGGLIKGAVALKLKRAVGSRKRNNGSNSGISRSIFETHKGGLSLIIETLVKSLNNRGVKMFLSSSVAQIKSRETGYAIHQENGLTTDFDAVVVAVPSYVAAELLPDVSDDLANELGRVEYVTTATVSLAYKKMDLPELKGYGYIIPQYEKSKALACTWTSTKWVERAPEDYALLRVFVGRIQDAERLPEDKNELIQIAKDEIRQTMGIEHNPVRSWVFRWEKAMPQYNLGHPERLERIEKILKDQPNIALAGNGYYGIGLPDCIKSGIKAADKLLQFEKVGG
ncbi:MAG: protoporphyrinogen oxidase [Chloroflexi bacterium]|nr:protoporphyrinogen oxidase [Chloroflexota bacterium]